jgi:phosphoglycerate dehydrogenase-like enzyme
MGLTIWTNGVFNPASTRALADGVAGRGHRLVVSASATAHVHGAQETDPALAGADVAYGQPEPAQSLASDRLRWIECSTAGYTRYDTPEFWEGLRGRGTAFTNASSVFADPCAQHLLAMMLALGRRLPASHRDQLTDRRWEYFQRRYDSRLLTGQTVVMLGFGAIGRRLAELLAPFRMRLIAVRRRAYSESGVLIVGEERLSAVLAEADHVVNVLPDNDTTRGYVNARRLSCVRAGARFYNVGRGTTVDQRALAEALRSGRLGEAYLDVTDPEPLPPEHELWGLPNCFITPHTAGGRHDQDEALVAHFLANLDAFVSGGGMTDRVV